jgi:hypothetical protein
MHAMGLRKTLQQVRPRQRKRRSTVPEPAAHLNDHGLKQRHVLLDLPALCKRGALLGPRRLQGKAAHQDWKFVTRQS